jgi:hypothetical protein
VSVQISLPTAQHARAGQGTRRIRSTLATAGQPTKVPLLLSLLSLLPLLPLLALLHVLSVLPVLLLLLISCYFQPLLLSPLLPLLLPLFALGLLLLLQPPPPPLLLAACRRRRSCYYCCRCCGRCRRRVRRGCRPWGPPEPSRDFPQPLRVLPETSQSLPELTRIILPPGASGSLPRAPGPTPNLPEGFAESCGASWSFRSPPEPSRGQPYRSGRRLLSCKAGVQWMPPPSVCASNSGS